MSDSGRASSGDSDSDLDLNLTIRGLGLSIRSEHSGESREEPVTDRPCSGDVGVSCIKDDAEMEHANDEDKQGVINEEASFFEGVEKVVEIWFGTVNAIERVNCDLRQIPRHMIMEMLDLVNCKIISSVSNKNVDAYLLSESSLFVSERRMIIKTCGTTTPLDCLKFLWKLVQDYTGFDCIQDLFYSHKNYKRPELQRLPYGKIDDEVSILDKFLEGAGGSLYCLGNMNKDCWYLYVYHHPLTENFNVPDQTLEIIMTELDPKVMDIFTENGSKGGKDATKKAGINRIIPEMIMDDFLFEPCGYSMNGIMKDGSYMTIHITPEEEFSYVSFETNVAMSSYRKLIENVVNVFQPRKFMVNFFANKASEGYDAHQEIRQVDMIQNQWICLDNQYCRLKKNDLTYVMYSRAPN